MKKIKVLIVILFIVLASFILIGYFSNNKTDQVNLIGAAAAGALT